MDSMACGAVILYGCRWFESSFRPALDASSGTTPTTNDPSIDPMIYSVDLYAITSRPPSSATVHKTPTSPSEGPRCSSRGNTLPALLLELLLGTTTLAIEPAPNNTPPRHHPTQSRFSIVVVRTQDHSFLSLYRTSNRNDGDTAVSPKRTARLLYGCSSFVIILPSFH